jgi:hypothetical protein
MTTGVSTVSEEHHHHQHGHHNRPPRKSFHKDWRVWTAVLIMLAAITAYVLSGDEMFGLRPKAPQPAPPAAGGK